MSIRGGPGSIAIVAVGATEQGKLPNSHADDIAIDALDRAIAEAQIDKGQIDGLITCKSFGGFGIDTDIGQKAGLNPKYSATLDYGTCNFSVHLAAAAIRTGLATTVACVYGTNQKTAGNSFTDAAGDPAGLEAPYGFFNVAGPAAMAFRRHQHLYGTTEEQLGEIAVASRAWASLNPQAIFREKLTIAQYLDGPYLVQPLRRPDLCMISDGGAALILASADRAQDLPKRPVYLWGAAQGTGLRLYDNPDQLMRPWLGGVAERTYRSARVAQGDIDLVYIQDPTSVWVLQMLEWFGFCDVGDAGPFLEGGTIGPGGRLPVNTNGGQLSEAYMWGWLHLCEAVRQLRGECGSRQVSGSQVALYCSTKGIQKGAASIFSTQVP